jgi:hypothetical protein
MTYKVKVYIPTQKQFGYVEELKNRDILIISKYIKANDDEGLNQYFDTILSKFKNITILDKFFILLQLRALNFSSKVVITGKHVSGKEAVCNIILSEILQKLLDFCDTDMSQKAFIEKDLKIDFKLPQSLYFSDINNLLNEAVENIYINSACITKDVEGDDRNNIIKRLKPDIIQRIRDHFNDINKQSALYFLKNEDLEILLPTIQISFFSNTIFNILKAIFKIEISQFYQKFYTCLTKLGISFSDYMDLSFIETDILLSIYKAANKIK